MRLRRVGLDREPRVAGGTLVLHGQRRVVINDRPRREGGRMHEVATGPGHPDVGRADAPGRLSVVIRKRRN